jgi:hypothetical protein
MHGFGYLCVMFIVLIKLLLLCSGPNVDYISASKGFVEFEVLTSVIIKITVFCSVGPCSLIDRYQPFGLLYSENRGSTYVLNVGYNLPGMALHPIRH